MPFYGTKHTDAMSLGSFVPTSCSNFEEIVFSHSKVETTGSYLSLFAPFSHPRMLATNKRSPSNSLGTSFILGLRLICARNLAISDLKASIARALKAFFVVVKVPLSVVDGWCHSKLMGGQNLLFNKHQ